MKTTARITKIHKNDRIVSPEKRKYTVSFETNFLDDINDLQDFELDCIMTRCRKKRSKEQNRLMWEFIDRIAEKTGAPVTEIYKSEIKEIGGVSKIETVPIDRVKFETDLWHKQGIGWVTEIFPSTYAGYKNVIFYQGSSSYNTEQMTRLINLVMQDAEALGIDTTPLREASLYAKK